MKLPGGDIGADGGVIFPAGIAAHTLVRRKLEKTYPYLRRRLLDPQVYLSSLSAYKCGKVCVKLMSYGWFPSNGGQTFDSSKHTQSTFMQKEQAQIHRTWTGSLPTDENSIKQLVNECVEFQVNIGCEAIILPSPLTVSQTSDYSVELRWLDAGLKAAQQFAPSIPSLATVALSDNALRNLAPESNELITIVVDQLTARGCAGAYLVIEQSNENSYYCAHPNTVGALCRLCSELKLGGLSRIVVGPIGTAGLLGIGAGADIWTAGWYRTERRIKLSDFEDAQGRTYPTYYSHPFGSEFHLEEDLDHVVSAGFLGRVSDETSASIKLLTALRSGLKVSAVKEWMYSRTNVEACKEHFLRACIRESHAMHPLEPRERAMRTLGWLRSAEQLSIDLAAIQHRFNDRTDFKHQASWLHAFESFAKRVGYI